MIRAIFGSLNTKTQIFEAEDVHTLREMIDNNEVMRRIDKTCLKYGYFNEYKTNPYNNQSYVIDNCMHFIWEVDDK